MATFKAGRAELQMVACMKLCKLDMLPVPYVEIRQREEWQREHLEASQAVNARHVEEEVDGARLCAG